MNHLNDATHHELHLVVIGKPTLDLEEKSDFLWSVLFFKWSCELLGYKLDVLNHTNDARVKK